jgi:hypothetical protein
MEARVYIDGFNLYYGIKKWPAYKWLNLEDLVDRVFPNDDIQLIRYFTARVKGKISPDSPARQQAYLAALSSLGRVETLFGKFLINEAWMPLVDDPNQWAHVLRPEEKGSDVNIATYLLLDGIKQPGTMAIIFSNDSDLREPIRVAQQPPFNLTVWVVNPRFKPKTKMSATHHIDLSIGDVRDSQFPDDVTLSDGKVVTRPETWRQEEDP